jgi:hypothetical protein
MPGTNAEIVEDNVTTTIHSVDENEPSETVTVSENQPKKIEIHEKNKEIWDRKYIFPMLAADYAKMKKDYGNEGFEKLFTRFKKLSDPSIPIKKIVTSIVRIRTLSNRDQSLGEYIFYTATLYGFQKHFDPDTSEITHFQSARLLDVPFGYDMRSNMTPDHSGGKFRGWKWVSDYKFFTKPFVPTKSIDEIFENSDFVDGINVSFHFEDMGKVYGHYTREELDTLRSDRLKARNEKKEMGSDIKPEERMKLEVNVQESEINQEVTKTGKGKK